MFVRMVFIAHAFITEEKLKMLHLNQGTCKKKRLYSKVGHTCVFAASLESLKSGHDCSRIYLVDDINITSPATNSRCQLSELTAEKH